MDSIRIVPLTTELIPHVNQAVQPFMVFGKLVPSLSNGEWMYSEILLDKPYEKCYEPDEWEFSAYIDNDQRIIFLAFDGQECVGQIVLKEDWNRYAFIEDICVASAAQRKGVGQRLIHWAADWAREHHLHGLALETQSNNLAACRFYEKCGFQIGGVNTMLYRNYDPPHCAETAIFWYLPI